MIRLIKWFALTVFCLLQFLLQAQDVITTTKGKRLLATVTDTRGSAIEYKYEGPKTYKISKKDVSQIQYADGHVEKYKNGNLEHAQAPAPAGVAEKMPPPKKEKSEGRKFLFGITAGGGAAWGRYDYNSPYPPPDLSMRPIPTAGVGIDWRVARPFAIHLNLLYKEKGDKIQMDRWLQNVESEDPDPSMTVTASGYRATRLQYLEASLMPVIVFGRRVELGVGGYGAYGLKGQVKSDYSVEYNFEGLGPQSELYQKTIPVEFTLLAPTGSESDVLYVNALDYGLCGHLGFRMNPLKLSLGLQYGMRTWEPDSDLAVLLTNSINHTYNLSGTLTLSWFFGAR